MLCSAGLMDGKHCTLPHLTGKTFVYSATSESLELCVDPAGHFPVGPDVEERVKGALVQAATRGSREGSPSHGVLRLGSGGVVRKKEPLQGVTAFQGKGHSLGSAGGPGGASGSSPPEHRPITRQHSSGTDLSASVSRGAPDLSDIPEDATRELVRMAPGFITTKDGRGLDPILMEQQRRELQEMVSSIQASMERKLREPRRSQERPAGGAKAASGGQPASSADCGTPGDGKVDELEPMDSQDGEQSSAGEPMDHS